METNVAKNRLAEIRTRKSMTQDQVTDRTDISQSDLSKYENCATKISVEKAIKLADCYDVSLDEIFMRDNFCRNRLTIKDNNRLSLEVEIENSNDIHELFKLLIENNYVASICKRSSISN